MGILSVTELPATGGVDEDGLRTYVRRWRVGVDTLADGPAVAISGIPVRRHDYYEESTGYVDYGALAEAAEAEREEDESLFWIVTVNYSSRLFDNVEQSLGTGGPAGSTTAPPSRPGGTGGSGSTNDPTSPANPLLRPASVSWGVATLRRAMDYDRSSTDYGDGGTNLPVVNSAGDKFDPPYEEDRKHLTLTIERNEATFDAEAMETYFDTTNLNYFWGWGPGFVKCESITATSEFENGFFFWKVRYEFAIRRGDFIPQTDPPKRDAWLLVVLDQGFNEIVSGDRKPIEIKPGILPSGPVPLNGLGVKLPVSDMTAGSYHYRIFRRFAQKDFAPLNLE